MDDNHQAPVKLVPLNWLNILTARHLAKHIFPKIAAEVFVCYTASLMPHWL